MKNEIPYYEDNSRISNSAIGWFLKKGPRYLKDMLDGKEEGIKGKFLEKGTMIHMFILQPEEFWQHYEILDFKIPSSKQQLLFAKTYADNDVELDEEKRLIDAFSISYAIDSLSEDKILKKAKELRLKLDSYIKYLISEQQGKIVISWADYNMLNNIKDNLNFHKKAFELLYNVPDSYEVHNEFQINWEAHNVLCKSLLDRIMIDHKNKKVILIDLKTTSDIYNFKHSVEEYDYYRQICFYMLAITWYFTNVLHIDIANYDFESYIIAIQTNGKYLVRVFNMLNEKELLDRKQLIADSLQKISYHIQSNNWDYLKEYYDGDGVEKL